MPRNQSLARRVVTACRTHQIILTGMCAQKCGHCPYPTKFLDPIPSARRIRRILRDAVQRRAVGIEISCGQGIAESDPILEACRYYGLNSFLDYLEMVHRCVEQMSMHGRSPLVPVWDLGPLSLAEMRRLRPILLSMKLSLESLDPSLRGQVVFRDAPAKAARWGLEVLSNAGKARIPVTAVTVVGIGEKPGFAEATLLALAEIHRTYGNLQSVCVRGFRPYPGTPMQGFEPVKKDVLLSAVASARRILPDEVAVQVQAADFREWAMDLVMAGVDDLGDIPLQGTAEDVAAVEAWERDLGKQLAAKGMRLRYRLPIFDSALRKGLYPLSLESRLNRAIEMLKNGSSPKHPEPLAAEEETSKTDGRARRLEAVKARGTKGAPLGSRPTGGAGRGKPARKRRKTKSS